MFIKPLKTATFVLLFSYLCFYSKVALADAPSGVISGRIFVDYNQNGKRDYAEILGLSNVTVRLYSCDEQRSITLKASTTTNQSGEYRFNGLNDGEPYRLEIANLPAPYILSKHGNDHPQSFRIVGSPNDGVHFGVNIPSNYCQEYPTLAVSCYVSGDPMAGGNNSDMDALVDLPYLSRGRVNGEGNWQHPRHLALMKEVGSVWGLAYQRDTKQLFVASFVKRHVGLGPGGIGAIYLMDYSKDVPKPKNSWIDLTKLGIDLGQNVKFDRDLSPDIGYKSTDKDAFTYACKIGIGDIEMSEDGRTLWVMNLFKRELIRIDLSDFLTTQNVESITRNHIKSFRVPSGSCSRGDYQPFAIKMREGKVFVGVVCTCETSQRRAELMATVFQFNTSSGAFQNILTFPLDYQRGYIGTSIPATQWWQPWRSEKDLFFKLGNNLPYHDNWNTYYIAYPQPVLSNLEFTEDGYMVLSFMDRFGHQTGYFDNGPDGITNGKTGVTGGDIIVAAPTKLGNNLYTVERNGKVGIYEATDFTGNTQGIGGREFINDNVTPWHEEAHHGSIALVLGNREVVGTALDADGRSDSGGIRWTRTDNGNPVPMNGHWGYELFYSREGNQPGSFGKAAGLGEIDALCDPAPMEIGGMIWFDDNNNGLQDPCESPYSGASVYLYDAYGKEIATTTTNTGGFYFFSRFGDEGQSWNQERMQIKPNSNYTVVLKSNFDTQSGIMLRDGDKRYRIAKFKNQINNVTAWNDSDGIVANDKFDGFPHIQLQSGSSGNVSHTYSFGFAPAQNPNARIAEKVGSSIIEARIIQDKN
ncbi:MAG: SdrD B-like domain-containing protein [Spirosomataceae bacterium]